jgi:[protein-PII] uridylyltransferase
MRTAARDAKLIDEKVRKDPRANELFLEVLTCVNSPEKVLRWMNEAGVFGRFVPDFGRVVAQMQFDMYHHYTVDEHSIRAIGLLAAIERGELKQDHPLSTAIIQKQIGSRRTLYTAVLLHDIAKGRGGDHSKIGAEIALKLGPRFGLDPAETETVSWLVRHHLLMSATAFKRDLADPKTVEDFIRQVQSPERLRLLLILTVVDIRAVGPGVWNEWKRVLLRTLYEAAEERLRLATSSAAEPSSSKNVSRRWQRRRAGKAARRGRMRSGYPTAIGWLSPQSGSWPMRGRSQRLKRTLAMPFQTLSRKTIPTAGHTRQCLHARPRRIVLSNLRRLAAPVRTSSMPGSTPTRDGMALDNLLGEGRAGTGLFGPPLAQSLVKAVRGGARAPTDRRPAARAKPWTYGSLSSVAPSVAIAERASTGPRSSRSMRVIVPRCSRARARDSRLRPRAPLGAHRHLRRARGRRLLLDRSRRSKIGGGR